MESLYKDRDVRRFIRAGGFFAVCMIITGAFLYYVHMEDIKKPVSAAAGRGGGSAASGRNRACGSSTDSGR